MRALNMSMHVLSRITPPYSEKVTEKFKGIGCNLGRFVRKNNEHAYK